MTIYVFRSCLTTGIKKYTNAKPLAINGFYTVQGKIYSPKDYAFTLEDAITKSIEMCDKSISNYEKHIKRINKLKLKISSI